MQETRKPILALTSSGVERVSLLDAEKLRQLASWLCHERDAECMHWWDARYPSNTEARDRAYDEQQTANGGYCDHCRDFAAELLVNSPLAQTETAVAA